MKKIRHLVGGIARTLQSAVETDFVANCLKNQDVLLKVAEELLKQQTMQSVALTRLQEDLTRLQTDLRRLEEALPKKAVEAHKT
jgi:uncharacterized protein YlxW (UPF0749 family)